MGRAQAVPTWHARAESRGSADEKWDGAQVFGRGGAEGGVRADAREWSNKHRRLGGNVGLDVRALIRFFFQIKRPSFSIGFIIHTYLLY